jgi:Ser/Thr protein kinase RdoA (MazF antagonist)
MANDSDFTYDAEETAWFDQMAQMTEVEREQMLDDLFEREVLQPVEVTERDYLTEAFQILDGEPIEAQKQHLEALGRYFAAKLTLAAA